MDNGLLEKDQTGRDGQSSETDRQKTAGGLMPGKNEKAGTRSMQREILKSMFMVIGVTLAITYAITIFVVYVRIRNLARNDIRRVAAYTAAAVNTAGEDYLQQLDVESDTRITLIAANGDVLYDSEEITASGAFSRKEEQDIASGEAGTATAGFENHLQRPEVQAALQTGKGEDIRHSDTIGLDMFYYALRLNDGNILRVSMPVRNSVYTALTLLPVMLLIGAGMLAVAYFLSIRRVQALVRPINRLNLDQPLENDIYEELKPLLQRIDESNKAKDAAAEMRQEFSANVSHELKTPLTSISGYAEILRDGLVKEEDVQKFAGRIYKEAQRLLALIEDTIQLSRLDEGEVETKKEEVDLFELSKEIIGRLSGKASDNGVHMALSGESCTVFGVRRLLDEMIYNIADNAIKYNRPGGHVVIWAGEMMGVPEVKVTDDGIGIAKEEQERIFERFYRVDKSRSKERGGTGLGLSIVKHGAELSGAKIRVTSALGRGTRMELIFSGEDAEGGKGIDS